MALGNLAVTVAIEAGSFLVGMHEVSEAAIEHMGASSSAVAAFQAGMMQAGDDVEEASQRIGGSMQAANDAIIASSAASVAAINGITEAADNVDTTSMGERVAFGLGAGVAAGVVATHSALDVFAKYVETRVAIIGISILTGITAAVLGGVYLVYKIVSGVLSVISSMMDGSFFKSENIDSLIAANKELLELQNGLHVSVIEAGALNETLKRLGIDKKDYVTVFTDAQKAMHANGEELDRLGVKYKAADGTLLDNNAVLQNAKSVLEQYTEGWDRNQAAVAIGMGSLEKITSVLSVTTGELEKSKARLDAYQLGITAGTQEMVAKYEQGMRDFSRENDLAAQGFKRVYADAILPIFNDLIDVFKEGWPVFVQLTREAVTAVMVLFYGLKNGFYIITESIIGTLSALASAIVGVAGAAAKFVSGDFAGAATSLATGWDKAKDRIALAGDNIVAQITENNKRIEMAAATDGREASIASARKGGPEGKDWEAAPDKKKEAAGRADPIDDVAKKLMEGKIKAEEDLIADEKTALQNRQSFLRNYYATDAIDAGQYYSASEALIRGNLAVVQGSLQKEIDAAEEYIKIHKTESDKKAGIVDTEKKIAEIRRRMAQEETATNTELAISYLSLSNERSNVAKSLMRNVELEEKSNASRVAKLITWRDAEMSNAVQGNKDLEREAARHRLAMIQADLNDRKIAIDQQAALLQNAKSYADQVKGYWLQANATVMTAQQKMAKTSADAMQSATDGIAAGVSQAILYGKNLGDSLKSVAMNVADAFIQSFIKTQIQKLLMDKLAAASYATTVAAQGAATTATAGAAAYASTAAIPMVGPFAAPAAAAAAMAATGALAATATAAAAGSVASAEGGFDIPAGVNPMTQLHQKEMVLPAAQADVIRGLARGGAGGGDAMKLTIVNQTSAPIGKVVEQRISATERVLIIRDAVVAAAQQFGDPNSQMSRSMNRNYATPRSRS